MQNAQNRKEINSKEGRKGESGWAGMVNREREKTRGDRVEKKVEPLKAERQGTKPTKPASFLSSAPPPTPHPNTKCHGNTSHTPILITRQPQFSKVEKYKLKK
jgi:hypothetical protein